MIKRNLEEYKELLQNLDDDDLHKELWMLDTHIQYLRKDSFNTEDEDSVLELIEMYKTAVDENKKRYSTM